MNRYITIPEEDILADPESAGNMLLRAVRRKDRLFFRALLPLGETLMVCFEARGRRSSDPYIRRFVFSPFRTTSADEIAAAVNCRDAAGETLLSAFMIDSTLWGLYAVFEEDEEMEEAAGTCR